MLLDALSPALMVAFLPDADAAFAKRQYLAFRQHCSSRLLGLLPSFDEYPDGAWGPGDIDSGLPGPGLISCRIIRV